jgi:DNA-binding MarR family transcriptional regulator
MPVSATDSPQTKVLAREAWRLLLGLTMSQRERFMEAISGFDMSPGDFKALMSLQPEETRPIGTLARGWRCDASSATWIVDRLESRGLVVRGSHPTDRRVKTVLLTEEGRRVKEQIIARLHTPPASVSEMNARALGELIDVLRRLPPDLLAREPAHAGRGNAETG